MRYEGYKRVDLPWVQEIPSHWKLIRNKNIFVEQKARVGRESENFSLLSLTLRGVVPRNLEDGGKFPESFDDYKIVKKGDMVFCLFDIDETPRTVGYSNYEGMITGAYTIMKVKNIHPDYVYYYFLALDNQKMLRPLYTGLRKTIKIPTFQSMKIPVPPKKEQEQIAKFLDWKINEINRLISLKKDQLLSVDKLKQEVLDSEYEKIKDYSEVKLKYLGKFKNNGNLTRSDEDEKSSYEAIFYGDIYTKYDYHFEKAETTITAESYEANPKASGNTLFFTTSGELREEIGKCVLYTGKDAIAVGGDMIILKPSSDLNAMYLMYALNTSEAINYRFTKARGEIIVHISKDSIGNHVIKLPNFKSQQTFVNRITNSFVKIAELKEKVFNEVKLLKNLKQSLISDVVTGKIDVRNIEIPDYEKVGPVLDEELEELEEEV